MKIRSWKILGLMMLSTQVFAEVAQTDLLKKAYQRYELGQYKQCLSELDEVEKSLQGTKDLEKYKGTISYWRALVYFKEQNFKLAKNNFEEAKKANLTAKEFNYFYAQTLYALNELEESRRYFALSHHSSYKPAVSLYYMGFISNELGDKKQAVKFFQMIAESNDPEAREVSQAAKTQIADIYLEQVEQKEDKDDDQLVKDHVIPQLKNAIAYSPETDLANELHQRIYDLEKKYNLVLLRMRNGKAIPRKRMLLKLGQTGRYDTNVVFQADDSTSKAAKTGAPLSVTDILARYTYYLKDYASIAPEFRGNLTNHFDSANSNIYSNNNYLLQGGVRTSWEHNIDGKAASFLFDYTYSKTYKDYLGHKSYDYFNTTTTLMLGERLEFFDFGESYVRLQQKKLTSYTSSNDSVTNTIRFEQMGKWRGNTVYLAAGLNDFKSNTSLQSSKSLDVNSFLYLPPVAKLWGAAPTVGLNLTFTNPYNNLSQRGMEILFNPNIKFAKTIKSGVILSFDYSFMKNKSKDTSNYAYTKHMLSVNIDFYF